MDCHDSGCWRTRPDRFDALDRCLDCGRHWSDHRREYTPSEYDALETAERERDEARATNAELHRRVQAAESVAAAADVKARTCCGECDYAKGQAVMAERDAWRAKAEALMGDLEEAWAEVSTIDCDVRTLNDIISRALRAHASKAVR